MVRKQGIDPKGSTVDKTTQVSEKDMEASVKYLSSVKKVEIIEALESLETISMETVSEVFDGYNWGTRTSRRNWLNRLGMTEHAKALLSSRSTKLPAQNLSQAALRNERGSNESAAAFYLRMMKSGRFRAAAHLAQELGITRSAVTNLLRLAGEKPRRLQVPTHPEQKQGETRPEFCARMKQSGRFRTVKELADYLGVQPETVHVQLGRARVKQHVPRVRVPVQAPAPVSSNTKLEERCEKLEERCLSLEKQLYTNLQVTACLRTWIQQNSTDTVLSMGAAAEFAIAIDDLRKKLR